MREELVKMPEFQTASTSLSDGSPAPRSRWTHFGRFGGDDPSSVLTNASKISGSQTMTFSRTPNTRSW